jgi:hypothetical protein
MCSLIRSLSSDICFSLPVGIDNDAKPAHFLSHLGSSSMLTELSSQCEMGQLTQAETQRQAAGFQVLWPVCRHLVCVCAWSWSLRGARMKQKETVSWICIKYLVHIFSSDINYLKPSCSTSSLACLNVSCPTWSFVMQPTWSSSHRPKLRIPGVCWSW